MSETMLNLSQQHNLFDAEYARPVTLIGAGMVGSRVGDELGRMGVRDLTVYDHDFIESHNGPMSVYRLRDLARLKVEALREIVLESSGLEIDARPKAYEGEPLRETVVCCVDDMDARRLVWQAVKNNPEAKLLVDTRTAAELVWVFAVDPNDPDDQAYYEHHLTYSNKEAAPQMCGRHGIGYVSMRAAAAVCANLTYWWQRGRKVLHHKELTGELECIFRKER